MSPTNLVGWGDGSEAVEELATVQRVVERRRLRPDHPKLKSIGRWIVNGFRRRELGTVIVGCMAMCHIAKSLPRGNYRWKPRKRKAVKP